MIRDYGTRIAFVPFSLRGCGHSMDSNGEVVAEIPLKIEYNNFGNSRSN